MSKIMKYSKKTDQFTTHTLVEPDYEEGSDRITELCTIDSLVYVSVPDSVTLPDQPEVIGKTLEEVKLDDTLKAQIKKASVHYRLIEERVKNILPIMKLEDGKYFMLSFDPKKMEAEKTKHLIGVTNNLKDELIPYMKNPENYTEEIEQWGEEQKAKLGLGE